MTTQTLPVGATTHHTEQTLKARYQEALAIHEAWSDRVRSSGGQDRVAAELQLDDAWAWVVVTRAELEAFRSVARQRAVAPGWTRPHGRSGVVGRGNRC
jgi:hypothetical protein